jgi:nucleotide-binding universal stress UspA family protein
MDGNIVVALDGSLLAERALVPALEIAEHDKSSITLVRVVKDFVPFECGREVVVHPWTDEERAEAAEYLKRTSESMDREVTLAEPVGETVPKLLEVADGADLLVMTSHGRTGFERLMLGSVTEKVVREARVPVLVVRSQPFHLSQVKRILVPLDGSELAEQALDQACRLAQATSAELVLCQVLDPGYFERATPEMMESRHKASKKIEEYLEQVGEGLPRDVSYSCLWETGSPARTLLELSQAQKIDLIVMTTHGRNGLDRLFCGSVAENVVRGSILPVLLVPKHN